MIYAICIILIIVIIKSIFSAGDTAFTYLNRAEIRQLSKKDKKAKKIRILMEDTNKFFGIIEVVINMSELLAGAIASITILEYLIDVFETVGMNTNISALLAVTIVTVVLAYIMLVFGGVLPKRIARNNPKKVAYKLIPILWIVAKINYPFERLIDFSTDFFSRLFNIKQEPEERITEKQLKLIIKEAKDEGVLEGIEKKIFMNTLKANDVIASKVMQSLEKIYLINLDDDISKILDGIRENKFSRIPVYRGDKSNIVGIFNVKDSAIQYLQNGIQNKEQITNVLRAPTFVKKDEKIFSIFKKLQKERQIIAVAVDKNDVPVGILTMEDILETLVGEIFDEDDKRK